MISQVRTAWIARYDNKAGYAGKLLGVITFTDGKSLKVWDDRLHEACKLLAEHTAKKPFDVRYQFRPNVKWGDALATIEDGRPEHEQYDAARERDEAAAGPGLGRYTRDMINKRTGTRAESSDESPSTYDRVMRRVG